MNSLIFCTLYLLLEILLFMKVIGIIPARYASTRFPAKPLVEIHGKTMIQRVYEQAIKTSFDKIIIATDDERIYKHAVGFDAEVLMTSINHNNGTERCAEVISLLNDEYDIVVNIQGDEPFVDPAMLDEVIKVFDKKETVIATLIKKIKDKNYLQNPNIIKVVKDINHQAIYFSRSAIPYTRNEIDGFDFFKHIGIYAFRTNCIKELVHLKPSKLEQIESLEQLRWLENGYKIQLVETTLEADSIDTPEDLERLLKKYF